MRLSKQETLYDISIRSWTSSSYDNKLTTIEISTNYFNFSLDQSKFLLDFGHTKHKIIVVHSHDVKFVDLLIDMPFLHV